MPLVPLRFEKKIYIDIKDFVISNESGIRLFNSKVILSKFMRPLNT